MVRYFVFPIAEFFVIIFVILFLRDILLSVFFISERCCGITEQLSKTEKSKDKEEVVEYINYLDGMLILSEFHGGDGCLRFRILLVLISIIHGGIENDVRKI